MKNGRFTHSQV
jgi:hypothetical protein